MSKPRIHAIIQARMASSRLPGKVLLEIGGEPMLRHVVERTRRALTIEKVIVATTIDPSDDAVAAFCQQRGYFCYRGSLHDVLDRYIQAARQFDSEHIVRITADCPVIDPQVIDKTVLAYFGSGEALPEEGPPAAYDFAANRLPPPWGRTYPIGLDTEVVSRLNLELAWEQARLPHQREHVMPFFYEQPERFRILLVNHEIDYGKMRWTVDTPEDLILLRKIFAHFQNRDDFSWLEVLAFMQSQPDLAQINAGVQHKDYRIVDERRHD